MRPGLESRVTILFALPAMCMGGSQRVLANVLNHIDTARFEPHLAVLKGAEMWLEVPPHVHVHELGATRARHASLSLARICWEIKPQTVLSTSAHLNSALVCARPLLPADTRLLIRQGADITSPQVALSRSRELFYKYAYRRADLVICQSDQMQESLIREFNLSRKHVVRIYNPVDIATIANLAVGAPNPFPDGGLNLVAAGRLSHEKGFDVLLKAMPRIRQAFPGAVATLVGEGPELPALQTLCRELNLESSVRFVGAQHNPYPFLKHAELVILPSRTEAFPNVVLEAIALGTAVVATNCCNALTEISSCREHLRVAKDSSSDSLASEILSAIHDGVKAGKCCPDPQFESRFGVQAITRQYEYVLSRGLRQGPAGLPEPLNIAA